MQLGAPQKGRQPFAMASPLALMVVVAIVLVLSAGLPFSAAAAADGQEGAQLVLSHSLVGLLNEVPGVWSATVTLPSKDGDSASADLVGSVELGELRLERQSASAVTLHLPSTVSAAGQRHRLAFNTISCEEYKRSKGKCFFFLSEDDEDEGEYSEGAANALDEDSEFYVDYVVVRHGRPAQASHAISVGDGEAAPQPRGRAQRRHGRKARRDSAAAGDAAADARRQRFTPTTAPLFRLQTVAADASQAAQTDAVSTAGAVTLTRELLTRDGVDVANTEDADGGELRQATTTKEYAVLLTFHGEGLVRGGAAGLFPATLELRGLTGNVQHRLAAQQRQHKLHTASTFTGRWVSPVLYLAGLYTVLWVVKVAMDRRAKEQEKLKAKQQQQQQQPTAAAATKKSA